MFNKLKAKLRLKLRLFLGISSLEENFEKNKNRTARDIIDNKTHIGWCSEKLENQRKLISQFDNKVEIIHNTVENAVHIGTDVRQFPDNREHSWAVVCIEGKMNIVKFVNLGRKDSRDVLNFLKQFEAGRQCVDTPNQEMFYDNLWKF